MNHLAFSPQQQAMLLALLHGGQPMGDAGKSFMPIMQGLGAQQQWMRHASPAQTQNTSNFGILASR